MDGSEPRRLGYAVNVADCWLYVFEKVFSSLSRLSCLSMPSMNAALLWLVITLHSAHPGARIEVRLHGRLVHCPDPAHTGMQTKVTLKPPRTATLGYRRCRLLPRDLVGAAGRIQIRDIVVALLTSLWVCPKPKLNTASAETFPAWYFDNLLFLGPDFQRPADCTLRPLQYSIASDDRHSWYKL